MKTCKTLGRFGHHPDPAIDFEVEVDALKGMEYDFKTGLLTDFKQFSDRLFKALQFNVGAVESCVKAKGQLRDMEARLTET